MYVEVVIKTLSVEFVTFLRASNEKENNMLKDMKLLELEAFFEEYINSSNSKDNKLNFLVFLS